MRLFSWILFLSAFALSCGHPDDLENFRKNQRRAHTVTVSTWPGSNALAQHKQAIVQSCRNRGISDAQTALVLSMAQAETTDISASQRDASKDGTMSQNYSAFNMNKDALQRMGWIEGQGPDLNQDGNLDTATSYILKGFSQFGEENFLAFHRGGSAALADGVSYGAQEYKDPMRAVQAYLMNNRGEWTSSNRSGAYIPHV